MKKITEMVDSFAAKLAVLLLALGCISGAWGATEVGTWAELKAISMYSGEFVLTNNIVADAQLDYIELGNYNNSVELDLAGYSISVPLDWEGSALITVNEGSSLTIKGSGTIDASSYEGS